jgi:Predicted secreted protein
MKKGVFGLILVSLAAVWLLSACSQVISEDMSGQTVTVKKGETFSIKLSGNPTTGYGWKLADFDANVLKQEGDPVYRPDSLLTGSGGMYTYKFTAQGAGTTTLNFSYARSWESNPPYKTFTLTVEVQ